jgi:peptide/nickel transport system permease protein
MSMAVASPGARIAEETALAERPRTLWSDAKKRIFGDRVAIVCLIVLTTYIVLAIVGYTGVLDRVIEATAAAPNSPPCLHNDSGAIAPSLWLGTDFLGRSVMFRFLFGVRIAMTVAFCSAIIESIIGTALGAIAGYFGGWVDNLIIWLFSTLNSVPYILLIVAFAYALSGQEVHIPLTPDDWRFRLAGVPSIVLALGLTSWVGLCRLIRGEVLKHRDRDYVTAARSIGLGHIRIIFRHILPNCFHIVIINFSLGLAAYVQAEVVLSFLGLGVTDRPSWGRMIDDAKQSLLKGVWWEMAAATFAIFVFSLAINLFGDALRDALDPRLRGVD